MDTPYFWFKIEAIRMNKNVDNMDSTEMGDLDLEINELWIEHTDWLEQKRAVVEEQEILPKFPLDYYIEKRIQYFRQEHNKFITSDDIKSFMSRSWARESAETRHGYRRNNPRNEYLTEEQCQTVLQVVYSFYLL